MNLTALLLKKLGPFRLSLLRRGKIEQLILMSNDLTMAEKVMLRNYVRGR